MRSNTHNFKDRIISIIIVVIVFVGIAFWFHNETKNPPNGNTIVYVTRTGSRYHYASCSYLHSSSIRISLREADDRGYGSCSRCDPPEYISEEEYYERKANRSPVFLALGIPLIALVFTGMLWCIVFPIIHCLSDDWFVYILFAVAYSIVLVMLYLTF